MNVVYLKGILFNILDDGLNVSNDILNMTILPNGRTLDQIESLAKGIEDPILIYDEAGTTVVGRFSGYSKMIGIKKTLDYKYFDKTYPEVVTITYAKPDITDTVEQNSYDIEMLNGAVEELAQIIGG